MNQIQENINPIKSMLNNQNLSISLLINILNTLPIPVFYDTIDHPTNFSNTAFQQYIDHIAKSTHTTKSLEEILEYFTKEVIIDSKGQRLGFIYYNPALSATESKHVRLEKEMLLKEAFLDLNRHITSYNDTNSFFDAVLSHFQKLFGHSEQSSILHIDADNMVRVIASLGYNLEEIKNFTIPLSETFIYKENNGSLDSACIINDLERYYHAHIKTTHNDNKNQYLQSSLEIPIMVHDKVQYIISIDSLDNFVFTSDDLFVANYIRTQFQILLRVFNLYKETLFMSQHDAMTGLMNRRFFDDMLNDIMKAHAYAQKTFFIVLYDLDHLKKINDTYGHTLGDQYILLFSDYLKKYFQEPNTLSRIGGDEFVSIVLKDDLNTLNSKILQMQEAFEKEVLDPNHPEAHVNFSYGIAEFNSSITSHKELLRSADQAMYKHKNRYK